MEFQLGPEEYRRLIELVYLGEWMTNAQHDPEHQDEGATDILQRLLSAQAVDGVGRDVESRKYYLEDSWADRLYDHYVLDYDDHVFWDELVERLAQRDLARERGVGPESIDREENLGELRPIEERYRRELEQHGLERFNFGDF